MKRTELFLVCKLYTDCVSIYEYVLGNGSIRFHEMTSSAPLAQYSMSMAHF